MSVTKCAYRFLFVGPASTGDMAVLVSILEILMRVIECDEIFSQLRPTLLDSFSKTLLPVLEEICHETG